MPDEQERHTYEDLSRRLLGIGSQELGPGATETEIEAAENDLELLISGGYRRFIRQFGWGAVGSLELYGVGASVPLRHDLVRVTTSERSEMEPALPRHLLPVMNDGFGDLYCLDTRTTDDPPIVLWAHEDGRDQVPDLEGETFVSWLWEMLDDLDE